MNLQKGKEMERQRPPLTIDPLGKDSRIDQVYDWVRSQVGGGDKPRRLAMRAVRTALTRQERAKLLLMVNQQLGQKYGFAAQWSGRRNGRLDLHLVWNAG